MEGKIFDGVISFPEEMKFKKRLFPDKPLERRKNDLDKFSPKTTPLKLRGNENEIMKFLGFSKIWRQDSKIYFSKKKKFFFGNIFERKFSPDFGENTRFHFRQPLSLGRNLFPEEKISFISKV